MTSSLTIVLHGFLLTAFAAVVLVTAQTEGDTGYDYDDAYDDKYIDNELELGLEPSFDVAVVNVTVVQGQTAVLPCSIEFLGQFKVAWVDSASVPLTYGDKTMVDESRFSVVRQDDREWNLQIRDIRWSDRGQYRCTVNTSPIRSNVTGIPEPEVTWYRRHRTATHAAVSRRQPQGHGTKLLIQNISRHDDDIYQCVAYNGVPPSSNKHIRVSVEFPPEVTLPNRRIGQTVGRDTVLECVIMSSPQALYYWEKDGRRITSSPSKHLVEAYDDADHTLILSLRVHQLSPGDYGTYNCVASNSLGVAQRAMTLYEYVEPSANTQSTSTVRRTRAPDGGHIGHVTTRTSLSTSGRQFRRRSTSGDVIRFVTLRPRVIVKDDSERNGDSGKTWNSFQLRVVMITTAIVFAVRRRN